LRIKFENHALECQTQSIFTKSITSQGKLPYILMMITQ